MLKLDDIKASIEALPENEFVQLRRWFSEKDWQKWDAQIEADTESGKLDFLVDEAFDEKREGELIKHRRSVLAEEIRNAQDEFREGSCKPVIPSEIMKEILS